MPPGADQGQWEDVTPGIVAATAGKPGAPKTDDEWEDATPAQTFTPGSYQTKPGAPIENANTPKPVTLGQHVGNAARWMEDQLPAAGMVAGTVLAPEAPIASAALGGAAGTALKRAVKSQPVNTEAAVDIGTGAAQGATAEMGGQIVGKGIELAAPAIKDALTPAASSARARALYERGVVPSGLSAEDQQLMRENFDRAGKYIARETRGYPIKTGEGGTMASSTIADRAADNLWQRVVEPVADTYKDVQRPGGNVAKSIRDSFTELDKQTKPAAFHAGEQLAQFFDGKPISVGEMKNIVTQLNNDRAVARFYQMSPNEQVAAELGDPALRGKVAALRALREQMFDAIGETGGEQLGNDFREARKDWGALRSIEDQVRGAKVPTPMPWWTKAANTLRGSLSPKGTDFWLRGSDTLFDFNNPNRLIPKSFNMLGATDLGVPKVEAPPLPVGGVPSRQLPPAPTQLGPVPGGPDASGPVNLGEPTVLPVPESRQLPEAQRGTGPTKVSGPSQYPISLGETTPRMAEPGRQIPEKVGTGRNYPPAPNLIRSNRVEIVNGEQPVEHGSNLMPASGGGAREIPRSLPPETGAIPPAVSPEVPKTPEAPARAAGKLPTVEQYEKALTKNGMDSIEAHTQAREDLAQLGENVTLPEASKQVTRERIDRAMRGEKLGVPNVGKDSAQVAAERADARLERDFSKPATEPVTVGKPPTRAGQAALDNPGTLSKIKNPRDAANPAGKATVFDKNFDKPVRAPKEQLDKFDDDTLEQAKAEVAAMSEHWQQFPRPGRFVHNTEDYPTSENAETTAYGIKSARPQMEMTYPWLKNLPKMTAEKLRAAAESGKGVEYTRLLNEAGRHVQAMKASAGPILEEYGARLEDAAKSAEGEDPDLARMLRDAAAGKYSGMTGLRSFIEKSLHEAEAAAGFDKAITDLSAEELSSGTEESSGSGDNAREANQQAIELGPQSTLPGLENAVAENKKSAAVELGRKLTEKINEPAKSIESAAGEMETKSPLFRGTGASPQNEMFGAAPQGKFKAGDEIRVPTPLNSMAKAVVDKSTMYGDREEVTYRIVKKDGSLGEPQTYWGEYLEKPNGDK